MESILSTAFGRVIDIQKGESSNITKAAARIFSSTNEGSILSIELVTLLFSKFYRLPAQTYVKCSYS